MPSIEPNYEGFKDFFTENRQESDYKFRHVNKNFERDFNDALKNLHSSKGEQGGIAMSIFLRAIKYLFAAQNLLLDGHQEEARILLRNIVELGLTGFLVAKSEEVFNLWKACRQLRLKSERNGLIPYKEVKNQKFRFTEIVKKNKTLVDSDHRASGLFAYHNQFSEYISHENLYCMIAKFDSSDGKTDIYVGQGAKSDNNRMIDDLDLMSQLLVILKELKSECE
ncbi:MAG: DUF5677 domain-containing protein [Candidatus Peribacter sp.]|nr:DUF5677 domain-containing protein [Candidatus Peribacter sp.]